MSVAYVVTTIQEHTVGVYAIAEHCAESGALFCVVGDRKTPEPWFCPNVTYLGVVSLEEDSFALGALLRINSYTRKKLGYPHAALNGALWIRETDDDNSSYPSLFEQVPSAITGRSPFTTSRFVNIYQFSTDRSIWPRGLPLNHVREKADTVPASVEGPLVLQAVADGDPDVDAVYQLTASDVTNVNFVSELPLIIPPGAWTPFNSQATTWPVSLPLMYLPATCSFRITDIWRSYVSQRLMPGLGATLVIIGPTVFQDRNEHDLMRDFCDEIEGYLGYEQFEEILERTEIAGGFDAVLTDLRRLYLALIDAGFFTSDELPILNAWISDMETLGFGPNA